MVSLVQTALYTAPVLLHATHTMPKFFFLIPSSVAAAQRDSDFVVDDDLGFILEGDEGACT